MNENLISRISVLINSKQFIAICLPANNSVDGLAASTSLYLVLKKLNKQVNLVYLGKPVNDSGLSAIDEIKTELTSGGDNLIISFPNKAGVVDNVNYGFEGDRFYVTVKPVSGTEKLDPSQVVYSYAGAKPEVIIVIDSPNYSALGELYTNNQTVFTGVDIVNIDRHLTNANFGTINLIDKKISSLSEIILQIIAELKIQIDKDIATNLYLGIQSATNNLTAYNVTAATYEAIANLLKNGAVKKQISAPISAPVPVSQPQTPLPNNQTLYQAPAAIPVASPVPDRQPATVPSVTSALPPQPANKVDVDPSQFEVGSIEQVESKPQTTTPDKPPADWLKPKIFKGSNLL